MAAELRKQAVHRDLRPSRFHDRDASGLEVHLVDDQADVTRLIEVKTSATIASDFSRNLTRLAAPLRDRHTRKPVSVHLVYGGTLQQYRGDVECVPWAGIDRVVVQS